jgi:Flp pilus assembly protein CpaB
MRFYLAVFGAILALVPALLYYNAVVSARDDRVLVSVYVLKNDPGEAGFLGEYVAGTVLTADNLQKIEVTETAAESIPWAVRHTSSGAQSAPEVTALLERPLTQTVPAGAILQEAFFIDDPRREFGMQIAPGKRAFSISVNEATSAGGFVEPESVVDIYQLPVVNNLGAVIVPAEPIVSKVRVLAVGSYFSGIAYEAAGRPRYGTVTVELDPSDISRLLVSREIAGEQMSLSLYNPCSADSTRFRCTEGN